MARVGVFDSLMCIEMVTNVLAHFLHVQTDSFQCMHGYIGQRSEPSCYLAKGYQLRFQIQGGGRKFKLGLADHDRGRMCPLPCKCTI